MMRVPVTTVTNRNGIPNGLARKSALHCPRTLAKPSGADFVPTPEEGVSGIGHTRVSTERVLTKS
jgi:hypothetical protein